VPLAAPSTLTFVPMAPLDLVVDGDHQHSLPEWMRPAKVGLPTSTALPAWMLPAAQGPSEQQRQQRQEQQEQADNSDSGSPVFDVPPSPAETQANTTKVVVVVETADERRRTYADAQRRAAQAQLQALQGRSACCIQRAARCFLARRALSLARERRWHEITDARAAAQVQAGQEVARRRELELVARAEAEAEARRRCAAERTRLRVAERIRHSAALRRGRRQRELERKRAAALEARAHMPLGSTCDGYSAQVHQMASRLQPSVADLCASSPASAPAVTGYGGWPDSRGGAEESEFPTGRRIRSALASAAWSMTRPVSRKSLLGPLGITDQPGDLQQLPSPQAALGDAETRLWRHQCLANGVQHRRTRSTDSTYGTDADDDTSCDLRDLDLRSHAPTPRGHDHDSAKAQGHAHELAQAQAEDMHRGLRASRGSGGDARSSSGGGGGGSIGVANADGRYRVGPPRRWASHHLNPRRQPLLRQTSHERQLLPVQQTGRLLRLLSAKRRVARDMFATQVELGRRK
jgi:hypothetical protein